MKFSIKNILFFFCLFYFSCENKKIENQNNTEKKSEKPTLFTLLNSQQTGIGFANQLTEKEDLNILNYLYFYNGAGVAVGDINNDGLADIYFTANQLPNKLYLNKGNFVFEDITEKAGVAGSKNWKTGVCMADVNGDGLLDIYVCQVQGKDLKQQGINELYINNGNLTFTEKAAEFGLDHKGYSTQATFFDYDHDGDLDMYLLNHSVHYKGTYQDTTLRQTFDVEAGDKLFQNNNNKFTDVSKKANIRGSALGYGLGVAIGDLNGDGWEDIYVSNDFHENDYLYYNNKNGTFSEKITQATGHTSRFSMGCDMADFNNDGKNDLLVLDMQPEDETVLKNSDGAEPYNIYQYKIGFGYHYQYARNTLQLNQGNGNFSEIALLSGVYATDWSWSALFCDLDNDGWKDIFISNGIARRPNDLDYLKFLSDQEVNRALAKGIDAQNLKFIEKMPKGKVANVAFRNNQDLTFNKISAEWGLDKIGFSNGSAYADLDNDGDLDLIVNNLNDLASVYRNESDTQIKNNFLKINLLGNNKNTFGIGTKVLIKHQGKMFYQEQQAARGFESSVEPVLTIGLGNLQNLDTVIVMWNDQKSEILTNVKANQALKIEQKNAKNNGNILQEKIQNPVFQEVTQKNGIDFVHQENNFIDFNREPLMPYLLSTQSPKIAKADVNGDGLEDFFVGSARDQAGKMFVQNKNGQFESKNQSIFEADKIFEDAGVLFFDADNDKDLDLYVVSAGNEFYSTMPESKDRLYLNDGKGNFSKSSGLLPDFFANGSCVKAADYDSDGDLDLFVGSRNVAWNYGISPTSFLLENDGKGKFSLTNFAEFKELGMVTDAIWADLDKDNKPELIVVGDWMPIRIFKFTNKKITELTDNYGLSKTNGWWNCLLAEDFDGDGDLDLVAGNYGLNSILKASAKNPVHLFVDDFDGNGKKDAILAYYQNDSLFPLAMRDELIAQIPALRKKFPNYADFAGKTIDQIFTEEALKKSQKKNVYTFASVYLENKNGKFEARNLPMQAQFSPIFSFLADDFDENGTKDLLLAGNFYGVIPYLSRADASCGLMLSNDGKGNFTALNSQKSGFVVKGESRDIQNIKVKNKNLILVGKNNSKIQIFEKR